MFNLFPPALAAQVVTVMKDIIPLLGIALIRVGLYVAIWFKKFHHEMSQAKLFKLDNISDMRYNKRLRA